MRALRTWHRRAGLAAALVLAFVTLTGIALNHTDGLALAERRVSASWLLGLYGVATPPPAVGYAAGGHVLAQVGDRLYLGVREIAHGVAPLVGAAAVGDAIVAATTDGLRLYTSAGESIETLDATAGAPVGLSAIGTAPDGGLRLRANGAVVAADLDALTFAAVTDDAAIAWSSPASLLPTDVAALHAAWRGPGLPLERVLLDLHSGRILGPWGVWLVDATAVLTLALALTGVWMWLRERPRPGPSRRR